MIRKTSLALVAALAAGPVLANSRTDAATPMDADAPMAEAGMADTGMTAPLDTANLIRTRDITGGDVYTLNGPMDEDTWGNYEADGVGPDWNDIGEIEDVVLDRSGKMVGVVAEIGGFLDIGDKTVFLPVEDVRLTPVDDKHYVIVTRRTEEELEQLPSVDEGWWD